MDRKNSATQSVILCGVGNTGSHLAEMLARCLEDADLVLIDKDRYTAANIVSQQIPRSAVGRSKVGYFKKRLQQVAGARLQVHAIHSDLNDVPLGIYRNARVVIGCLDSVRARADLQLKAWRAAVPWCIDVGVRADERLARVTDYAPTVDGACYLCGIEDWEQLNAVHLCNPDASQTYTTNAPAYLGAAAAALAAGEFASLATGELTARDSGREVVLDLAHLKLYVTRHTRNPACRFDHATWSIQHEVPDDFTIGQALGLGDPAKAESSSLRVDGRPVVRKLRCYSPDCGRGERSVLRLAGPTHSISAKCPACKQPMIAGGFDMVESLSGADLIASNTRCSLRRLGLRPGDVFSVRTSSAETFYQIREGGNHGG